MKLFIRTLIIGILTIMILGITLFPILWMFSSSLKPEGTILSTSITWIPKEITLTHYKDLFNRFYFQKYLLNSIIIAVSTTIISIMFGVVTAYGFSRYNFPGSRKLLFLVILVRLFTPAALVVPLYELMSWLGLSDTLLSIIIGVTALNMPFVVYMMKAFFDAFPRELEEAAMVDGMGPFRILISIVIPLVTPVIVTIGLFCFIAGWNDFFFGLSFSQSIKSMPATVAIVNMDTGFKIFWGAMMAGGTVLSIPVLLITFILQKYYIRGLTMGALK